MAELNQYQQTAVITASPLELVLMVYDECIRRLILAEEAFGIEGPERIEQIGTHLRHAQNAITELSVSLDMEQGGQIAEDLSRLYEFMAFNLSQANVKKEIQRVREVKTLMSDLRDTWKQVSEQVPSVPQQDRPSGPRAGRYSFSG
jgi:flagellar protein FliS